MNTLKIHDYLIANLHQIKSPLFVKDTLIYYNVHNIFKPIYEIIPQVNDANIFIVFLILSYSNNCSWIMDYEKDRGTLKLEILRSILEDSGQNITEETMTFFSSESNDLFTDIVNEYLDWQKDRTFYSYMSLSEHISVCNRQALKKGDTKDIDLKNRTQTLNEIQNTEKLLQDLKYKIERKYISIDESLKKEKKAPLSKNIDIMNYESRLLDNIGRHII